MRALIAASVLFAGSTAFGWQLWQALSHGTVRNLDGREIIYRRDVVAFRTVVGFYAGLFIAMLYTIGLLTPETIGEISALTERILRT